MVFLQHFQVLQKTPTVLPAYPLLHRKIPIYLHFLLDSKPPMALRVLLHSKLLMAPHVLFHSKPLMALCVLLHSKLLMAPHIPFHLNFPRVLHFHPFQKIPKVLYLLSLTLPKHLLLQWYLLLLIFALPFPAVYSLPPPQG